MLPRILTSSSLLRFPVAIALLIGAATAAQAFDPWGVWIREEGGTKFDFYNCDNKLCAKVVDVTKPEERNGIGTVILRNAEKKSDNNWAGEIFNPRDGKTYTGKVRLETYLVRLPHGLPLQGRDVDA